MKGSLKLNHPLIAQRYFFPRHEPFKDVYFVECNGVKLSCYYQNDHPGSKTIVFFHGNGEVVADYLDFFPSIFDQAGYNLFLFEFRGYGLSTGSPLLVEMLKDVESVLKQLEIEEKDFIFYGRSVGSMYAIHAASLFPNAYALILESGMADVEERILMRLNDPSDIGATYEELQAEFKTHFNTEAKLKSFKGRSFAMHTFNDQLVSVEHAEKLYSFLNEPKKKEIFERGDHNTIFFTNRDVYFNLIFDFLRE